MNIFRRNDAHGNNNPDDLNNEPDPNLQDINPLDYIENQLKMNETRINNGVNGSFETSSLSRQSPDYTNNQFPNNSRNDSNEIDRDGDFIPDQFDSMIDRDRDNIPDSIDGFIDADLDGIVDIDMDF